MICVVELTLWTGKPAGYAGWSAGIEPGTERDSNGQRNTAA